MSDLQYFIERRPFLIAVAADAVLEAPKGSGEYQLFHGLRIMLNPILAELSELETASFDAMGLNDRKDQTELCQARLKSVIEVVDFVEANDYGGDLLMAALHLLRLAEVVITAKVEDLYSQRDTDDEVTKPIAPVDGRAQREAVAA